MAFKIIETKFIGGYNFLKDLPKDYPQIALLGRSNAGKSTLVNRLCNRKSLAKTSKTPGRTQEFNFFEVTYKANDELKKFHLVDLPGFGFAKFSKVKQNALSKNIVNYLTSDLPLLGILLLNDSRRTPKEDEFAIQKLCFNYSRFLQIILTKIDKLKKNDIKKQKEIISKCYNLEADDVLLSGNGIDVNLIWNRIFEAGYLE